MAEQSTAASESDESASETETAPGTPATENAVQSETGESRPEQNADQVFPAPPGDSGAREPREDRAGEADHWARATDFEAISRRLEKVEGDVAASKSRANPPRARVKIETERVAPPPKNAPVQTATPTRAQARRRRMKLPWTRG